MHHVLCLTPLGQPAAEPIPLDRRRRRLSTVVARHNHAGPRVLVFKVPEGHTLDMELHVVKRSLWASTLVGAKDSVVILPLVAGGGGRGGGAGKGVSIAIALAGIALIALGQWYAVGGLIAKGLGVATATGNAIWSGISAGLLLGASVLAQSMMQAKANKPKELYGVSGGGNLAKLWERRPVTYGQTWVEPDLTQADYMFYDGDDVVLVKRMSIGEGKYNIKSIRVGDSTFWTAEDGVKPPFNFNTDPQKGAAVEFLYGTPSAILPGNVYSSTSVTGFEIARAVDNPDWSGPFPVCQPGDKVARIQIDRSWPQGVYTRAEKSGNINAATVNVIFQYREIDDLGVPVGAGTWATLHQDSGAWKSEDPIRKTTIKDVPLGRYEVRARSNNNRQDNVFNAVNWDGLRGLFDDTVSRPGRTELVMRIRSGKSLSVTSFSTILVKVGRILPIYDAGSATWSEAETRLAKWAAVDILRAEYGAGLPDSGIDLVKFASLVLPEDDTFDGTIRGPVSVWEALGTVLSPIRADVVKFGNVYSFVRDEPKAMRQHVLTRRNIIQDSSSINFDLGTDRSAGDVIVDFLYDGDPKRPMSVRSTVSTESRTPKRVQPQGITDPYHAKRYADFLAAVSAFRLETCEASVEYDGRLYAPGDLAYVDVAFYSDRQALQVERRVGLDLYLDGEPDVATYPYCVLRDRKGRRFGPIAVTAGAGPYIVSLDEDDVAAAEAETGLTLANVLAKDKQDATAIQFGALAEIQRNYLVKAAVPDGPRNVKLSLVYDDPRVWAYIGANMPAYVPPSAVSPDYPVVLGVSAWVSQNDTRLTLHWIARLAADAPMKEVELSYDEGETWANIYAGPASSGTSPIAYNGAGPCWLRARGIGESGNPGDWTTPVIFTTPKPSVFGGYLVDDSVLNQAIEAAAQVTALRSQIEALADDYRRLAKLVSNDQAVTSNEVRQVRVEREQGDVRVTAAFVEAITAVATDVGGLAERTTALEVTVDTPTTGLLARVGGHDLAIADLGDAQEAMAEHVDEVEAKTDAGTAYGSIRWTAISAEVGVTASWRLEASVTGPGGDFIDGRAQLDVIAGGSYWQFEADAFLIKAGTSRSVVFSANPDETLTLGGVTKVAQALVSQAVGANGEPYMTIDMTSTPRIVIDDGEV